MGQWFQNLWQGIKDLIFEEGLFPLQYLLRWLAGLSPRWHMGLILGMLLVAFGVAHLLQRWLKEHLRKNPDEVAPLSRIEAILSIVGPLFLPLWLAAQALKRLRAWAGRLGKKGNAEEKKPAVKQGKPGPRKPVLVATLGPTFFLAGILSGGLYWLGWLTGPLVAQSLGLSSGTSPWQYLILGRRPEFAWLLPLEAQPYLAVTLTLFFWLVVWWSLGNILRGLVYRSSLHKNLIREQTTALPQWYSAFGVWKLTAPARSYRNWASWCLAVGMALAVLGWFTLERPEGAIAPAAFAVALVLGLSWLLHLWLRGLHEGLPQGAEQTPEPKATPTPGWPEVVEELQRRYRFESPEVEAGGVLVPLKPTIKITDVPNLSPLLGELLELPQLTSMQQKVLRSLAWLGYVHLEPPTDRSELTLSLGGADEVEDRSGLAERHQIVLAPEGSGKTTLAMLAAANQALVHARATLIITRSEAQAEACYQRILRAVEPSTVRWNLRVRRVGRDFAYDLSRDIVPDVVVCSLKQLVTSLLDNAEVYAPYLRNVGLVVVDDVESFAGAVEIHAQLAFRRLQLLFRQLLGVEQLGEESLPLWLVLGVDSMKETAAWAKTVCGTQGVVRLFPAERHRESGQEDLHWQSFRFNSLRAGSGRPLTVREVVQACEMRRVPWHYRPAGDGRRYRGRGPLLLEKEPEFACDSPRKASVLLLEGRWSEVRRELLRLPWMGSESGCSTVTALTLLEPEEEIACEALLPHFGLEHRSPDDEIVGLAEELATLPMPVVRPPSSDVMQPHLLSDLTQHWIEVEDLVGTFESRVARSLRRLRDQGMLYTEERKDVRPELKEYESLVYVRALASALAAEGEANREEGFFEFSLFDKVRQVELVSRAAVAVRNRADHTILRQVEADSAGLVYYPGRVFEDRRGRFVVVGRLLRDNGQLGAIEVEPVLHDGVTSPRRTFKVRPPTATRDEGSQRGDFPLFEPEAVLLGRDPIEVGLLAIRATIRTLATYRLDRTTGEVHSREMHTAAVQQRFQREPLETRALVLRPNPKGLPEGAPKLNLWEARLLAALLRLLLPLLYRDTRDNVEVALDVHNTSEESSPPWNTPLGHEEGLYLLDLHQGGNGTAWALYREGLELPLRFCRHFLLQIEDLRRLQRLYDHWGTRDEILAEGYREEKEREAERVGEVGEAEGQEGSVDEPRDGKDEGAPAASDAEPIEVAEEASPAAVVALEPPPWQDIRRTLLGWLDSRLHPEATYGAPDEEESLEAEDSAQGSGEAA